MYPRFEKPFTNSIFPTCTFNYGPHVMTLEHINATNVPYGFCAIFACRSYDPVEGGHLILFDLGLVVWFPPGSVILVPSGTMCHSNVATRPLKRASPSCSTAQGNFFDGSLTDSSRSIRCWMTSNGTLMLHTRSAAHMQSAFSPKWRSYTRTG